MAFMDTDNTWAHKAVRALIRRAVMALIADLERGAAEDLQLALSLRALTR